jgi:CheY-like chemotaxis protein
MRVQNSHPVGVMQRASNARDVSVSDSSNVDIVLCQHSNADAKLTLAGVRRGAPDASSLRVRDDTQVLRLVFQQGLFTVEPQIPRLILLDFSESGEQRALERLRANPSTRDIPIVIVTSDYDRVPRLALAVGVTACVKKCSDEPRYINSVARVISACLRTTACFRTTLGVRDQRHIAPSSRCLERHRSPLAEGDQDAFQPLSTDTILLSHFVE